MERNANKDMITLPDAAAASQNPGANVWGWMFWLNGGLHMLFLIAVVIFLWRS
jgi:hypothetical protein